MKVCFPVFNRWKLVQVLGAHAAINSHARCPKECVILRLGEY